MEDKNGAHEGRSTLTQLINQHDYVIEDLGNNENVDIIFLDFAKPYDLVDVSILLVKIRKIELCGKVLNWLNPSWMQGSKM